jgi:hypothetical protein
MRSLLVLIVALALSLVVAAQKSDADRPALVIKPTTTLVDQFGVKNSEERSMRFDNFFQQISRRSGSVGYIVLYCGKMCQYGEIEAHMRGIEIKISLRQFERSNLVIVNGGFREKFDTELWLVENGSSPPEIRPTVNIKYVSFAGTTRRTLEYYDCCDDYRTFWKNLKP